MSARRAWRGYEGFDLGRRGIRTPDLLGVKRIRTFPKVSRTVPHVLLFDTMPRIRSHRYPVRGKDKFEIDLKCGQHPYGQYAAICWRYASKTLSALYAHCFARTALTEYSLCNSIQDLLMGKKDEHISLTRKRPNGCRVFPTDVRLEM